MARRRRDRSPVKVSLPSVVVSRRLPMPRPVVLATVLRRSPPPGLGDRRLFHPAGVLRPAAAVIRSARRLVPARKALPSRSRPTIPERIGFAVPKKVMICVRRKQRREVIHAKRLQGKGAGSRKSRNLWSAVSC